jgi:twinkle protein
VQNRQNSYAKSKKDNVAYEMPFPHPVEDDSVSAEDDGNSFGLNSA